MRWFSTRDLLDIAGVPFTSPEAHPTRLETLAYYRGVAERFGVRVRPETDGRAHRAAPRRRRRSFRRRRRLGPERFDAPAAILATGFFPTRGASGVPGEDQPHVHSRYVSGYPFHGRNVVVVGGKNSAAEAALDLYRHGARVTLVVRGPAISDRVKYWIKPDLENRIAAGAIARALPVHASWRSARISSASRPPTGRGESPRTRCFPLIGYEPDFALFERCGIRLEGEDRVPAHDPETLESNVPGPVSGGRDPGRPRDREDLHREQPAPRGHDRRRDRRPARGGGPLGGRRRPQPFAASPCFRQRRRARCGMNAFPSPTGRRGPAGVGDFRLVLGQPEQGKGGRTSMSQEDSLRERIACDLDGSFEELVRDLPGSSLLLRAAADGAARGRRRGRAGRVREGVQGPRDLSGGAHPRAGPARHGSTGSR